MSAITDTHDHHHNPTGWKRWAYSTNHKDIEQCILSLQLLLD